jgi:hypothetical protein
MEFNLFHKRQSDTRRKRLRCVSDSFILGTFNSIHKPPAMPVRI